MGIEDKVIGVPKGGRFRLELDELNKQVRLVWAFEDVYHAMQLYDHLTHQLDVRREVVVTLISKKG